MGNHPKGTRLKFYQNFSRVMVPVAGVATPLPRKSPSCGDPKSAGATFVAADFDRCASSTLLHRPPDAQCGAARVGANAHTGAFASASFACSLLFDPRLQIKSIYMWFYVLILVDKQVLLCYTHTYWESGSFEKNKQHEVPRGSPCRL